VNSYTAIFAGKSSCLAHPTSSTGAAKYLDLSVSLCVPMSGSLRVDRVDRVGMSVPYLCSEHDQPTGRRLHNPTRLVGHVLQKLLHLSPVSISSTDLLRIGHFHIGPRCCRT